MRLVVLILGLLVGMSVAATPGHAADDRFSTEPVHVAIGRHGYLIPRNYIDFIRYDRDGRPLWVHLKVLWPGLEPLTTENAHLWERRLPERQIRIAILQQPEMESYRVLEELIALGIFPPDPVSERDGLSLFEHGRSRRFASIHRPKLTPSGQPLLFACDDVSDEAHKYFEVELICITKYDLLDDSGIRYYFFEKNLPQWREIDDAVRALVQGFQQDGAQ